MPICYYNFKFYQECLADYLETRKIQGNKRHEKRKYSKTNNQISD